MGIDTRLWKNTYKIGDKTIDAQHYQLFYKIERLMYIAKQKDVEKIKKECDDIIEFLVNYTVEHFRDEEEYQKKVGYVDYEIHKKIHNSFKNTVALYHKQLKEDFSSKTLKYFVGTLLTWLVVHVSNCDKKIATNEPIEDNISFNKVEDLIKKIVPNILKNTYGIQVNEIKTYMYKGYIDGDVYVRSFVEEGDSNHVIIYSMSEELVRDVYTKMTTMEILDIKNLDEIEVSMVKEICNILSSYLMGIIAKEKTGMIKFWEDLYCEEYEDSEKNLRKSVMIEFVTDKGIMEVVYCLK